MSLIYNGYMIGGISYKVSVARRLTCQQKQATVTGVS